jgi:hypothetical protein
MTITVGVDSPLLSLRLTCVDIEQTHAGPPSVSTVVARIKRSAAFCQHTELPWNTVAPAISVETRDEVCGARLPGFRFLNAPIFCQVHEQRVSHRHDVRTDL